MSEGTSQLTSYSYLDDYQPNQVLAIFDRWAKQNFQQNPILRCLSTCASYVDRSLSSRLTLTLVQVPGAKLVGSDMYGISQGCDHLMVGLSQFYPPCESGDGTGARTRIVSLKGWCPDRLDDTAIYDYPNSAVVALRNRCLPYYRCLWVTGLVVVTINPFSQ